MLPLPARNRREAMTDSNARMLQEPVRVVTLNGTSSKETFGETEQRFDAIFASFNPFGSSRSGA